MSTISVCHYQISLDYPPPPSQHPRKQSTSLRHAPHSCLIDFHCFERSEYVKIRFLDYYFFCDNLPLPLLGFLKRNLILKRGGEVKIEVIQASASVEQPFKQPVFSYTTIFVHLKAREKPTCVVQEWPLSRDYSMTCSTNLLLATSQVWLHSKMAKLAQI